MLACYLWENIHVCAFHPGRFEYVEFMIFECESLSRHLFEWSKAWSIEHWNKWTKIFIISTRVLVRGDLKALCIDAFTSRWPGFNVWWTFRNRASLDIQNFTRWIYKKLSGRTWKRLTGLTWIKHAGSKLHPDTITSSHI